MKKLVTLGFILGMVVGLTISRVHVPSVHAQITSPSYACNTPNQAFVGNCVQYVVQFSNERLGGGTWIYQMQQAVDDLPNDPNASFVTSGGTASIQALQPNSSENTITVSLDKP